MAKRRKMSPLPEEPKTRRATPDLAGIVRNSGAALPKISDGAGKVGALIPQLVRCGKPGCKCARGVLHGPYYYRFFRDGGRLKKVYVRKADVEAERARCEQYAWLTRDDEVSRAAEGMGDFLEHMLKKIIKWGL